MKKTKIKKKKKRNENKIDQNIISFIFLTIGFFWSNISEDHFKKIVYVYV